MTKREPPLPEKVLIYIPARAIGKTLWAEELKRRAIEKGKTVLVMRKGAISDAK